MRYANQRGFTVLELFVAMMITLVVAAGTVTFVRNQSVALKTQLSQTDVNDEARALVEFMARELRHAGFEPRCASPSVVTGIVAADPTSIRIQYDLDENGAIDAGATASEDVTYQYVAATTTLQRVVGGVATNLVTNIPAGGFAFRYYDTANAEIIGAGGGGVLTAAQRAAVYRISIKFAPVKQGDSRIAATNVSSTLWTNVLLRNRAYPCVT
jgi:type II secretory pathway component PulJ